MKGNTFSKIVFNNNIGKFTYDSNLINANSIIKKINKVGERKLDKVTDTKDVATFVTK